MNKILLKLGLTLIIFLLPIFVYANTGLNNSLVGPNDLSSGLIAWWTFDGKDILNGVIKDKSGNNNSANLLNISTSTFYIGGVTGQAARFDGSDDRMSLSSDIVGASDITISLWTKIYSQGGGSGGTFFDNNKTRLYLQSSGRAFLTSNGGSTNASCATNGLKYDGSKWFHLVYTRTSGGVANCYIDGSLSGTADQSSGTLGGITSFDKIGNNVSATAAFDGIIDDFRIYGRVLSATEIRQLYNSTKGSTFNASFSTGAINSGLVAYWTFDGKDIINNLADISGNNKNGYLQNFAATSSVLKQGKIGQGLSFDGNVTSIYLLTSPISNLSLPNSVCSWANSLDLSLSPGGWYQSIINFYINGNNGMRLGVDSSGNLFVIYRSAGITKGYKSATPVFVNNIWYHVCYVWDGNNADIYSNGTLLSTTTDINTPGISSVIGAQDDQGDGNWYGSLDDIRVYNKALTPLEIKQIYNVGKEYKQNISMVGPGDLSSGLIGWFTFDGPYMTKNVKDKSTQNNNGYMLGFTSTSTAVIAGKSGQGLIFDGINDQISTLSDFIGTSAVSVSVWIKPNLLNSLQRILSNGKTELTIESASNRSAFKVAITGVAFSADNSLTLNKWIHIAATRTSGGVTNIYVNGLLSGTANQSAGSPVSGTTNVIIGNVSDGTSGFKGSMDDMRIYNRVLSASEILKLYNMGR